MKRFLALVLAALLVLTMGLAAMAEGSATEGQTTGTDASNNNLDPSEAKTVNLTKVFKVNGDEAAEQLPNLHETLAFTSEPSDENPDETNLTITPVAITDAGVYPIVVNVPSYSNVGKYIYTIAETEGSSQGVTYDDTTITFIVQVGYDYENGKLIVVEAAPEQPRDENGELMGEDKKDNQFDNNFDVGGTPDDKYTGLTVEKTVTGNLADKSKYFTMHVTLTAQEGKTVNSFITVTGGSDAGNEQTIEAGWTGTHDVIDIKLKDGEKVSFKNIPAGVSYTVVEDEAHTQGDVNSEEGYTATYENKEGTVTLKATQEAVVTNEKKTEVLTGVSLSSLPYVLIVALVIAGAVIMMIRRRRAAED